MAAPQRVVQFESAALAPDTLLVTRVTGTDEISSPYRYELELVSRTVDIDFTKVLRSAAQLGIKKGVTLTGGGERGFQLLRIHGMLATFRQEEMLDKEWVRYHAVLVPRLWALSLTVRSRVFLEKSVKEIVETVLKEAGLTGSDYEFRLSGKSPAREYVVQYQESDLDFLSRWLEHEGICYFFEQAEDREKVVFADAMARHQPIAGDAKLGYRPRQLPAAPVEGGDAPDWFAKEVVSTWVAEQSVIPAEVVLKDYNWRKPSLDLRVSAPVAKDGVGHVYEFASHYKDKDEGEALAKVRAEELNCRKLVFRGQSDCRALRAGAKFTLTDHFRKDFNVEYLIVSVQQEADQKLGQSSVGGTGATYRNLFTAVPAVVTFRPARKTAWPSIHGVMNAIVDAGGDGKYAEIDDQGRYKVKTSFDISDNKDGKASRYVRMAQPYSGAGMGMHFPLHKGTEVLLTFIDGDPDRPIIASAVPNAETSSPVQGGNASQCAIHTGGGTKIVIEDAAGSQQLKIESPTEGSFFTIGAANSPAGFNLGSAAHMNRELGGNELLKAAGNQIANIAGNSNHMTGGSHKTVVAGSKKTFIGGSNSTVVGASDKTVVSASSKLTVGASRKVKAGASIKHQAGASHTVKAGASVKIQSGAATNVKAGSALKMQSGAATSIKAGAAVKSQSGAATQIKAGGPIKMQSGGPTNLKAGGPINAQGASINIKGPTNVKGATKIKGDTKIKGATKIDGATSIKGATKIKGDTKITGNTKINGNNLNVT